MQVSTSELRTICERLLAHLDELKVEIVDIPYDIYWDVPQTSRYDPYQEPKEYTIGQLTDDWAELRKVLQGTNEPLGYHFVWLAAILRAVGEEIVH